MIESCLVGQEINYFRVNAITESGYIECTCLLCGANVLRRSSILRHKYYQKRLCCSAKEKYEAIKKWIGLKSNYIEIVDADTATSDSFSHQFRYRFTVRCLCCGKEDVRSYSHVVAHLYRPMRCCGKKIMRDFGGRLGHEIDICQGDTPFDVQEIKKKIPSVMFGVRRMKVGADLGGGKTVVRLPSFTGGRARDREFLLACTCGQQFKINEFDLCNTLVRCPYCERGL